MITSSTPAGTAVEVIACDKPQHGQRGVVVGPADSQITFVRFVGSKALVSFYNCELAEVEHVA